MDFNTTIDLIIKDLNDASEIIDDLRKYPGVPALQVELAKSKCRSAGDVIALLKTINIPIASVSDSVYEKQPIVQQAVTDVSAVKVKDIFSPEGKKKDSKRVVSSSPSDIKSMESEYSEKKPAEVPIVADKFSHVTDLYDQQSENIKKEKDLSDRLKIKNIASLSEAIGISDKFLFMGEIFKGNKDTYAQAISRLDNAENLEDAKAIIMSYAGENSESEAVNQLLELVKLKLGSDE